jgi:hypothetical protein
MSVPIVNSAVFLTKFTTAFIQGDGAITFCSVSANPTNLFENGLNKRVWRFTLDGHLLPSQDEYILRFDFSKVEVPLTYSFEDDVVGIYTLNRCKPQNARGMFDYTFDSELKILNLRFFNTKTILKTSDFYFDLSIFDSTCPAANCNCANTYCNCSSSCKCNNSNGCCCG